MTTKDAIKLLPIEDELKTQILNSYDYMEPGQKLTISRIAWKTYDMMYERKIAANVEEHLKEVEAGKGTLGENFFNDVVDDTNRELTTDVENTLQKTDLVAARQAMQQIMDEIRAHKKAKVAKHK